MFIKKTLTALLMMLLLFGNLQAQMMPKTLEISAELEKNALDFLRQTVKEIPNLKAEENRQFFTIEAARLLWKYDEKESRAMFESVIREVKQSFGKTAEKYKKAIEKTKKERVNANANYAQYNAVNRAGNASYSNRYAANYANAMKVVEPYISAYELGMAEEFRKVATLRKNLLENLIEVEPNLAYQFLTETNQILPKNGNEYFYLSNNLTEKRIVDNLLNRNEVDKSIEIARDFLGKEFSEATLYMMFAIYQKDKVKGSGLIEESLQKIKLLSEYELGINTLTLFFDAAIDSKYQEQPMLSDKSLRELARLLGKFALSSMSREYYFTPYFYAKKIEKYAPREALKILQKAKQKRNTNSNIPYSAANAYPANYPYYAANTAENAVNAAVNAAKMAANTAANYSNISNKAVNTSSTPTPNKFELQTMDKYELLEKLRIGKFTAEERNKAIKLAKEYALTGNPWGYSRPDGFIRVVGELARFSIISADREVADELMKEAEIYVRPETKNYIDYIGKLLLAGGYSSHHPDKSFALMESMVSINEVIEGAVKLGAFVDIESYFILNDEISATYFLGEFGGTLQGLSSEMEFRTFIQNLAKSDFQRTKSLADKFEKNEIKITAKMLILDSLLGEMHQ